MGAQLDLTRWIRIGAAVNATVLAGDGRYILAGSERDLRVLDPRGDVRLVHSMAAQDESRFHLAAMTAEMDVVLAAVRSGHLYYLDLERTDRGFTVRRFEVFRAENDLYDLALAADGKTAAIGHLDAALTVLDLQAFLDWVQQPEEERPERIGQEGLVIWRRHPNDGNPTDGQRWAAALDAKGDELYVGSSGPSQPVLAALDAQTGQPHGYLRPERQVTRLVALTQPPGVVAVLTDGQYLHSLVCYAPQLDELHWERNFDKHITALTADPAGSLLAVGSGWAGRVELLDASSGRVVASYPGLNSVNTCLALADGRYVAAGTQDGHIAYLQYRAEEFRL